MNIFLIPHTWIRHISPALIMGSAALIVWWLWLTYLVVYGRTFFDMFLLYNTGTHGSYFLASVAATLAFTTILQEGSLYRRPVFRRIGLAVAAGFFTWLYTLFSVWFVQWIFWSIFVTEGMAGLYEDPSLTTLRYRILQWIAAGWCSSTGPMLVRRGEGFFNHFFGGIVSGGIGAAVWHYCGYNLFQDYYLAPALGVFAWGFTYGLFVWPIPKDLYAGWIRVLSDHRYAYRIPIDHEDGTHSERFIGHFPRGLDLFLPVDKGVAELHMSVLVDDDHNYAVRGLSVWPTMTRRFLESIDLRYDPTRPAPLQTTLSSGDRMSMSDGVNTTHVEFVLLPKEER